jgi:hypothetical protein
MRLLHALQLSAPLVGPAPPDTAPVQVRARRHLKDPAARRPQGHCARCMYSAPQLLQLGWAAPLATLVRETLPVATDAEFTLPAVGRAKSSVLVVVPDWQPPASGSSLASAWYYIVISYRVQGGQDEDIEGPFRGAASVHFVARAPDVNPYYMGSATAGQAFVDRDTGLVVRVPYGGSPEALQVVVCRFDRAPSQCKA